MASHNKEADQTVKMQHFPADKTLTGLPSNAYIPILDIVETRDIIISKNICNVHGYAC